MRVFAALHGSVALPFSADGQNGSMSGGGTDFHLLHRTKFRHSRGYCGHAAGPAGAQLRRIMESKRTLGNSASLPRTRGRQGTRPFLACTEVLVVLK
jgi:hypothetical protein